MKTMERRLRELEAVVNVRPLKPVRRVIVELGEDVDEVLAREGIVSCDGDEIDVIVRVIVEPTGEDANTVQDATD